MEEDLLSLNMHQLLGVNDSVEDARASITTPPEQAFCFSLDDESNFNFRAGATNCALQEE